MWKSVNQLSKRLFSNRWFLFFIGENSVFRMIACQSKKKFAAGLFIFAATGCANDTEVHELAEQTALSAIPDGEVEIKLVYPLEERDCDQFFEEPSVLRSCWSLLPLRQKGNWILVPAASRERFLESLSSAGKIKSDVPIDINNSVIGIVDEELEIHLHQNESSAAAQLSIPLATFTQREVVKSKLDVVGCGIEVQIKLTLTETQYGQMQLFADNGSRNNIFVCVGRLENMYSVRDIRLSWWG